MWVLAPLSLCYYFTLPLLLFSPCPPCETPSLVCYSQLTQCLSPKVHASTLSFSSSSSPPPPFSSENIALPSSAPISTCTPTCRPPTAPSPSSISPDSNPSPKFPSAPTSPIFANTPNATKSGASPLPAASSLFSTHTPTK